MYKHTIIYRGAVCELCLIPDIGYLRCKFFLRRHIVFVHLAPYSPRANQSRRPYVLCNILRDGYCSFLDLLNYMDTSSLDRLGVSISQNPVRKVVQYGVEK